MNVIGRPLWVNVHHAPVNPRWHSFKLVVGTDQRWLWVANARIDVRGMRVSGKLLEFLLREAGGG